MLFRMVLRSLAILVMIIAGTNWWFTNRVPANFLKSQVNTYPIIEEEVLEAINVDNHTDFVVQFTDQAELSNAATMNWQERGYWVYHTLLETAQNSQRTAISRLEQLSIRYYSSYSGNRLFVWGADMNILSWLAALPEVHSISVPHTSFLSQVYLSGEISFPGSALSILAANFRHTVREAVPQELTWAVIDTKADLFWSTFGLQGEGIVVANLDTGVQYDHPALFQAYKCKSDPGNPDCWFDPENHCGGIPCDPNGHGTATMGTIVGDNDPSLPYQVGVAPGAQWITCMACSNSGCSDYGLTACADWIIAPDGDPNNRPHVVSNSWGSIGCDGWFLPYINAWQAAGIVTTFAPGGEGSGCGTLGSPGDYQEVFASTAHDSSRQISPFAGLGPSCYGDDPFTKPNISAPGVDVIVPIPTDDWVSFSGSSVSNSYGAGSMVLLLSCSPDLIGLPYDLMAALQNAADTPPAGYCGGPPDGEGNYTYGYGYVNLLAAGLQNCDETGYLEGQVTDAATSEPLAGASVIAEPVPGYLNGYTDPNGYYTMTLVVGNYTVTASMSGYYSQTLTATILISETTILDFALEIIPPEINVVPETISVTLFSGESTIELVTVSNWGSSTLTYTVTNPDSATWLSFSPQGGEMEPGENQIVNVSLDSAELSAAIYTTTLVFSSNDPITPLISLPVTLTVLPVGLLEGYVSDAASGDALEGAMVTAEQAGINIQSITDPTGYYSMTLPPGDYQVTAEMAGHYSLTLSATVVANETTLLDFALESFPPVCEPISGLNYQWSPDDPAPYEVITFTANVTGGTLIDFFWDFGDGITATGVIATHTFSPGSYNVTLRGTNACSQEEISYTLIIETQTWWLYLPLVSKD